MGHYAFSFNGVDYKGNFQTREAALAAAQRVAIPPGTVFIGRVVPCESGATGHARAVLAQLVSRHRQGADDVDTRYIINLSSAPVDELDGELERTIVAWLNKHHLNPVSSRVVAISEHPVPTPYSNHTLPPENHVFVSSISEVSDLGVEDVMMAETD